MISFPIFSISEISPLGHCLDSLKIISSGCQSYILARDTGFTQEFYLSFYTSLHYFSKFCNEIIIFLYIHPQDISNKNYLFLNAPQISPTFYLKHHEFRCLRSHSFQKSQLSKACLLLEAFCSRYIFRRIHFYQNVFKG